MTDEELYQKYVPSELNYERVFQIGVQDIQLAIITYQLAIRDDTTMTAREIAERIYRYAERQMEKA